MSSRTRATAAIAGLLVLACQPGRPVTPLTLALDSLTPGIRLGVPAGPLADSLHFGRVAMVGYGDTTYRTAFGLRGIRLFTGDGRGGGPPDDPGAPVAAIVAGIPPGYTAWRAIVLLDTEFGKPERWCQLGVEGRNVRILYWAYDPTHGIAIRLGIDPTEASELTVGAPRLDPDHFSQGPCAAPGALPLDTAPPPPQ